MLHCAAFSRVYFNRCHYGDEKRKLTRILICLQIIRRRGRQATLAKSKLK